MTHFGPFVFLGFIPVLVALVAVVANLADRRRRGWPIFLPRTPQPDFQATWVSVGSTFPVVARRCAWIRVANGKLAVHQHFPWSILVPTFLAALLGFEAELVLDGGLSMEERYSSVLGEGLALGFDRNGRRQNVTVWTSKRDSLSQVIAKLLPKATGAV